MAMKETPLKASYDSLRVEPEIDQVGHAEPEHILRIGSLSDMGLPPDPSTFLSPARTLVSEQMSIRAGITNLQTHYRSYKVDSPEVLRHIFSFLAPIASLWSTEPWEILMPLMQVCRLWTSTIYDMPEMWENIVVTGSSGGQDWLAQHLDNPKAKVTRLNIVWENPENSTDRLTEALLLRYPDRRGKLLDALRKAHSLRELTWCGIASPLDDRPITLPSVRSLDLDSGFSLPPLILPSLTNLDLTDLEISIVDLRGLADQSPNLRVIKDTSAFVDLEEADDGVISSPPRFQALEVLMVSQTRTGPTRTPIWLTVATGASNLTTVHLANSVLSQYEEILYWNLQDFKAARMQRVRSLVIGVDLFQSNYECKELLRAFTGVENLELQLLYLESFSVDALDSPASIKPILETSCTNTETSALFPNLKRLSISLCGSYIRDPSGWVRALIQCLVEARFRWRCFVSLKVGDIVFLDVTAEEFGNLLGDFETSWPSIHDAIHKNVPFVR